MPIIDLKSQPVFHYSPAISQEEQFNEFRQNHFLSNYGSLAVAHVSAMCSPLPRKPQGKKFYMLRPVSLHNICPTDFPRKPSGYRSVPSCPTKQTLPNNDDFYVREFGYRRPIIPKVVDGYMNCRDLTEGFASIRCSDCYHE